MEHENGREPPRLEDHYADLVRYATRLSGCRYRADDVVQESYLRAYRWIKEHGQPSKPGNWLRVIARNVAYDASRNGMTVTVLEEGLAGEEQSVLEQLAVREGPDALADALKGLRDLVV